MNHFMYIIVQAYALRDGHTVLHGDQLVFDVLDASHPDPRPIGIHLVVDVVPSVAKFVGAAARCDGPIP